MTDDNGNGQLPLLPDPGRKDIGLFSNPAVSGAPETQLAAAISVYPTSGSMRRRVLDIIIASGARGMTDDELEAFLRARHQSVSARRNELARLGWIADSGDRRPTSSGREAAVWKLSSLGRSSLGSLE